MGFKKKIILNIKLLSGVTIITNFFFFIESFNLGRLLLIAKIYITYNLNLTHTYIYTYPHPCAHIYPIEKFHALEE